MTTIHHAARALLDALVERCDQEIREGAHQDSSDLYPFTPRAAPSTNPAQRAYYARRAMWEDAQILREEARDAQT